MSVEAITPMSSTRRALGNLAWRLVRAERGAADADEKREAAAVAAS